MLLALCLLQGRALTIFGSVERYIYLITVVNCIHINIHVLYIIITSILKLILVMFICIAAK